MTPEEQKRVFNVINLLSQQQPHSHAAGYCAAVAVNELISIMGGAEYQRMMTERRDAQFDATSEAPKSAPPTPNISKVQPNPTLRPKI
jgi:hypothetical protein